MPQRVQRKRTRGWRAPEGAAYVGRGTRYGNPWAVIQTNTGTGWAVQWAGHADQHRPLGLWTVPDDVLTAVQRQVHIPQETAR
ncbi:DUF4326 domain-containing protein [Streptomyces anthocyanicus]|uniref:DUF4326 domain-containing protein n=1 Tax=Streptomyces anthocyanicus TaxID=68174 RepID=UPI003429F8E6